MDELMRERITIAQLEQLAEALTNEINKLNTHWLKRVRFVVGGEYGHTVIRINDYTENYNYGNMCAGTKRECYNAMRATLRALNY